jgi:hypothetical protein
MREATRRASVLAVLVAVATVAHADSFAPKPILVRIEGHVGRAREHDRNVAQLTLRERERVIDFTVDEIWVLSGDAAGTDVIHEVEQYTPSMSVSGPAEVLERLRQASPDDPLELTGYYRRGQRMLMLSSVEPRTKKT